jgi:hypothetical protein
MSKSGFLHCIALTSLLFACTLPAYATKDQVVTTWWPDPSTGLMWSGGLVGGTSETYDAASANCAQLAIDGRTGWRLPTIDELDHVVLDTITIHYNHGDQTEVTPTWMRYQIFMQWLWSSTPTQKSGQFYTERVYISLGGGSRAESNSTDSKGHGAVCVRTMEPDVLEAAKAASIPGAVPNLAALKFAEPYGPLFKAVNAYDAGQYQQAFDYCKQYLAAFPDKAEAYYNVGVSEGALGQWDQAIVDLNKAEDLAKKINNGKDTKDMMKYILNWAKKGQSAAQKGKTMNQYLNVLHPPLWE